MKKLYLLSIFVLTSIALIYSCSTEEEDTTPPPSVVATPEPEPPAPTQYTLTVTAGEGGSVSTEGGTYDEGTEVTITATPNEGYEFVGWEGSDSDSNSLTVTLNSDTSIQALFERNLYLLRVNKINHSELIQSTNNEFTNFNLPGVLGTNINGTVYIENGNYEFLIFPGHASCVGTEEDCQNFIDVAQTSMLPAIVLKKVNDEWIFDNYDINGGLYEARNSDVKNNLMLFSDGNEIGEISTWRGPLVLGEVNGASIDFKQITAPEYYGYYHDADIGGDINNDGLYDIVATMIKNQGAPSSLGVFIQNEIGEFLLNNSLIEYPFLENGRPLFNYAPFGIACEDLDGDNRAEIITYSPNFLNNSDSFNQVNLRNNPVVVYKFDETSNKFVYTPNDYQMPYEPWSPVSVDVRDLNNDGVYDLVVNTENLTGSSAHASTNGVIDVSQESFISSFDVWIGKENNKFEFKQSIRTYGMPRFMDVNNDGYEDIITQSYTKSGGMNRFVDLSLTQNGAPCPSGQGDNDCLNWIQRTKNAGINLNSFIHLNNGDGGFNQYQNDIIVTDMVVNWLIPYMKENKLHFVGLNTYNEIGEEGFDIGREIKYGYDINNFEYTIYDIELNLF